MLSLIDAFDVSSLLSQCDQVKQSYCYLIFYRVYSHLCGKDLLVEVPLIVRNSLLIQAFLTDWLSKDPELQRAGEFDALEFTDRGNFVEKSL